MGLITDPIDNIGKRAKEETDKKLEEQKEQVKEKIEENKEKSKKTRVPDIEE